MFFNRDGTPQSLDDRLRAIEYMLYEGKYDVGRMVKSKVGKGFDPAPSPQIFYGCWQAYCVDTVDPHKANRVRFYTPMLHNDNVMVGQLPWALPISNMGGFDDCGCTWPPPAGSRLIIIFEHGDRRMPYWLGTSWDMNRGPNGSMIPGPQQEWQRLWAADRARGYLIGKKDGSQVFPPWNTESYNGYDYTSDQDFEKDVDGQKKISHPNIYGFKTPGRHRFKMVDGNHNCNDRWKRIEISSARQNTILMKDDHLHEAGQWAKNVGEDGQICCANGDSDLSQCKDLGKAVFFSKDASKPNLYDYLTLPPKEKPVCSGETTDPSVERFPKCANPYYKREEECRPFQGARRMQLPQSGMQLQTVGGNQFVMDDSVEEPRGKPTWELGFDLGCSDKYKGRMTWRTWGGHFIDMSDDEEGGVSGGERWRTEKNWIKIGTASGHLIEMNEHSGPGCQAMEERGITIQSTSQHHLKMMDDGNEQCGPRQTVGWPPHVGQGEPTNKAKNGYVELRSGYGLLLRMSDDHSQDNTQKQSIILRAWQKDNAEMGPHELLFQEAPSGPGLVMLTVGGNYYCVVKSTSFWQVGEQESPSVRMDVIFGNYLVDVEKGMYFNKNDLTLFLANSYIILGAGKDCPVDEENAEDQADEAVDQANANIANVQTGGKPDKSPCLFPIIVAREPWACPFTGYVHFGVGWGTNNMSDRVMASASNPSEEEASEEEGSEEEANSGKESHA